jgi:two-component system, chemotaxis family, chemotaxis protein CheY
MDGNETLRQIRSLEQSRGVAACAGAKVFMTTSLNRPKDVIQAFNRSCNAYLLKPIDMRKIREELRQAGLSG